MRMTSRQLADVLVNGALKADTKKLGAVVKAYVEFLASRKELHRLPSIEKELGRSWSRAQGFSKLTVESAHPISSKESAAIEKAAGGADVSITVNPGLLGGVRIQTESALFDASIAGSLEQLKQQLVSSLA